MILKSVSIYNHFYFLIKINPIYYILVSGDLTLPKGISCIINVIGNHHMPELYPNPLNFNPDNFEPENVAKRHKYSLVAFSGGPRGCLG